MTCKQKNCPESCRELQINRQQATNGLQEEGREIKTAIGAEWRVKKVMTERWKE